MNLQSATYDRLERATYAGTIRHRAEDDLFHFDRGRIPKATECDVGLFGAKASAQHWVLGPRPRWLVSLSQPLVRPAVTDSRPTQRAWQTKRAGSGHGEAA
jgi:hypothetical protein